MSENPLEKALTALEEARKLRRNPDAIEWDWSGVNDEEWQKDDPMLDSEEFQAILKHLCDTERTPLFQSNEKILGGKPCFWKTRIPVQLIVDFLQQGWTVEEVLRNYPGLTEEQVRKCYGFLLDPLAIAKLKGDLIKAQHLQEKVLTPAEAAALLGITEDLVEEKRSHYQLLGLPVGDNWFYPAWQFQDGKPLRGLWLVLSALKDFGVWQIVNWFKTGDIRLDGRSPLEVLRSGEVEAVVDAAKMFGEHSAS